MGAFKKIKKAVKKVAKATVAPMVSAPAKAIKKYTGISEQDQLLMAAGVGGAMLGRGARGPTAVQGQYVDTGLGSGYVMDVARSGTSGSNWMGLAPSLLGFAGDIYGARTMAKGQEAANAASLQSAREQMVFQERMSSSSHQREVADLRAAGLNPVLSANAGASSPSGESVTFENEAPNYRGTVSSAVEAGRAAAEIRESLSRAKVNEGQLYVMAAQEDAASSTAAQIRENTRKVRAEAEMSEMFTKYARENPGKFNWSQWFKYVFGGGFDKAVGAASTAIKLVP